MGGGKPCRIGIGCQELRSVPVFDDCVDTRWSGKEGMASGHTGNRCVSAPACPNPR